MGSNIHKVIMDKWHRKSEDDFKPLEECRFRLVYQIRCGRQVTNIILSSSRQEIKWYETLDIDVLADPSSLGLQLVLPNLSWIDSVLQASCCWCRKYLFPSNAKLGFGVFFPPCSVELEQSLSRWQGVTVGTVPRCKGWWHVTCIQLSTQRWTNDTQVCY